MTLQYIFSQNYLFDPIPPQESRLTWVLLVLFSVMILFAIIIKFTKAIDHKIKDMIFYPLLSGGVLGLLYLFCRTQALPWLGSRFFLAVIFLLLLIWLIYDLIWMIRYIPKVKEKEIIKDHYQKYLPKKKKK